MRLLPIMAALLLLAAPLVLAQDPDPADTAPAAVDPAEDPRGDTWDDDRDDDRAADGGSAEDWSDEGWSDEGWGDEGWGDDDWEDAQANPWNGFVEAAAGSRGDEDEAVGRRTTLAELRWRVERNWLLDHGQIDLRADALLDAFANDLEFDVRELVWSVPVGRTDIRAGRQVLTWGTGDLLFLNDLFPKGWVSFFIGRDDEYLKAPSDALRATWYSDAVNLDVVAMALFDSDEYLTGERLSFFSPAAGGIVAPRPPLNAHEPSASLDNTEWAVRAFRNFGGDEVAVYGFRGFYHQPSPVGPSGQLGFPRLSALGASWRRQLGPGLFNAEVARYYSRDDRSGTDPRVPNDQARFLLGYEWEAARNFTVGLQAYDEWTLEYDALLANSPWPQYEVDEHRVWLTNRLTWRTRQDRLVWSLFTFWSPTDHDHYLRPQVEWRISDTWSVNAGGNLFGGRDDYTFFAQFEDDSNVYARVRFNY